MSDNSAAIVDFIMRGGVIEVLPAQKVSRKTRTKNIRSDKYRVYNTRLTPKKKLKTLYK